MPPASDLVLVGGVGGSLQLGRRRRRFAPPTSTTSSPIETHPLFWRITFFMGSPKYQNSTPKARNRSRRPAMAAAINSGRLNLIRPAPMQTTLNGMGVTAPRKMSQAPAVWANVCSRKARAAGVSRPE